MFPILPISSPDSAVYSLHYLKKKKRENLYLLLVSLL